MNNILGPTQIPSDANFTNTVIVGYPGADKRTVLRQMEALTTLSGRDSWDMKYLGMTNQESPRLYCFILCYHVFNMKTR